MNPALSLSSCVSSAKSLHLSEPWFPHLYDGRMQHLHQKPRVKMNLGYEIKYLCCSMNVSKIGLFETVHRLRAEKRSQSKEERPGCLLSPSLGTAPPLPLPDGAAGTAARGLGQARVVRAGHAVHTTWRLGHEKWRSRSRRHGSLLLSCCRRGLLRPGPGGRPRARLCGQEARSASGRSLGCPDPPQHLSTMSPPAQMQDSGLTRASRGAGVVPWTRLSGHQEQCLSVKAKTGRRLEKVRIPAEAAGPGLQGAGRVRSR